MEKVGLDEWKSLKTVEQSTINYMDEEANKVKADRVAKLANERRGTPPVPLLIEIHHNREQQKPSIEYVKGKKIKAIYLTSIVEAENWIRSHKGIDLNDERLIIKLEFLKLHKDEIRILTNNNRPFPNRKMDVSAGGRIVQILNADDDLSEIPILIYTSQGIIKFTRGVEKYPLAGSTSQWEMVKRYIDGLIEKDETRDWAQFNAQCK